MNRENYAIGMSVPADKGLTLSPCLTLPVSLPEVITQAKTDRATNGKANAYSVLLDAFHRAILPVFLIECRGNQSEVARLLGLHRETVKLYAAQIRGGAQ